MSSVSSNSQPLSPISHAARLVGPSDIVASTQQSATITGISDETLSFMLHKIDRIRDEIEEMSERASAVPDGRFIVGSVKYEALVLP